MNSSHELQRILRSQTLLQLVQGTEALLCSAKPQERAAGRLLLHEALSRLFRSKEGFATAEENPLPLLERALGSLVDGPASVFW